MRVKDQLTDAPRKQPSFAAQPSAPDRFARLTVIAFACFVAWLVLVSAFFTDRNGDVDELMMYNPSYMLAHFGKLTFPTYSYRAFYDAPVIIHPPIHLGLIGLLEKAGFTWYYAEAIPTVLFLLLGIFVIVFSVFPAPVKLGLLFSIGSVMATGEDFVVPFGTRPEGALYAAWFAGLVLLESGRLANWNWRRLFAGAFLLTWASGVHYYACAAFLGVVVYLVWVVRDLGWPQARSRVIALCAGGCLFGIPYLGLYLLPHLKQILMYVRFAQGEGGLATSIRIHFSHYQVWAHSNYIPALVRTPMGLGIPLVIFSTFVLGAVKSTRGIALAALPLQVFIFLFAAHKLPNYLIHEIALFVAAAGVGALAVCDWLWRRIPSRGIRAAFLPGAAGLLCFNLATDSRTLKGATIHPAVHVHEADLTRAATRQILGPHARVTGRDGGWYTSGADYWYDIERDMLQSTHYDPISFFSNFDAAVDYAHQSETGVDGTMSSWYADGALKLRGFYFGETNAQLQLVLLSTRRFPQVVGYAAQHGRLYRFDEQPAGDYQLVSSACPMIPEFARWNWISRWPETFSAVLYLPHPAPGAPAVVATVLAPIRVAEPAAWMHSACKEIVTLRGTLTPVDQQALLDSLRHGDTPMHFPRMLENLPGYAGVKLPEVMLPPANGVRVDGVLRLSEIQASTPQARVERLPQIRITTIPLGGAFAAMIPVIQAPPITGPCWVQLRLKVLKGQIGIAAYSSRIGLIARTGASIVKSSEPMDVVLRLPSLRNITGIVIFNDTDVSSQVEVLDAGVWIPRPDQDHTSALLH
jgi:hypothetical protein